MKIRLSDTDSINSINKNNIVTVGLNSTSKKLPPSSIIGEIDSYEVFENERNKSNNYRLILTINPYCTNILFNPLTEIVKNEGSVNVKTVRDNTKADTVDNAYGLKKPSRIYMLMNTEYSRNDVGYVYLPGFDIFNNHIMRNKTFKIVNKNKQETDDNSEERQIFNTIRDYLRYMDGSIVEMGKRLSVSHAPSIIKKHLYYYDDVMTLEESINTNLSEENGWLGFVNTNHVPSKEGRKKKEGRKEDDDKIMTDIHGYGIYDDLGISKILSNYENCEFIDMYPDRSLFSFNPKVNTFRKRLEYNWDIALTYPYKNEYCHELITNSNGKINGLKLMSVSRSISASGSNVLLFRSYIKHGLKRGDFIRLYVDDKQTDRDIKITNVGNLSMDNNDSYYFYTTDTSLLEYLGFSYNTSNGKWEKEGVVDINEELLNHEYRIKHIVNNIESEYYIRVFRKIPNLRNRKENLTNDIAKNEEIFEDYLYGEKMNASSLDNDGIKKMIDFNKEQYRLAFSRTIYNDASTQVTFTDTINTEYLVDNLKRPLHEFYITFIKSNRGYNEWYGITYNYNRENNRYTYNENNIKIDSENVEFSHCFGNISSGIEFFHEQNDRNDSRIMQRMAQMGDVRLLNELSVYNPIPLETEINHSTCVIPGTQEMHVDEFYGDIVEYIPSECAEYILQPICHRFNTAQREMPDNSILNVFNHDEIKSDDLDYDDFKVETINESENANISYDNTLKRYTTIQRPEGYFYQAHYPITIKEFGSLNQNAHSDLKVREAKPVQKNGIFIEVTTTLNYGVVAGDIIYVCVDNENNYRNDKWFEFTVAYTEGKNKFCIQPYNMSWQEMKNKIKSSVGVDYNWITLSKVLVAPSANENYTQLKLRRKNNNIPDYATRIDHNKFLWRDLYRPGELLDSDLTQYPFANNAFYINKEINFFLKRQDPYGYSGLYCSQAFPNDVAGNHKEEDNYVYKTEDEIIC